MRVTVFVLGMVAAAVALPARAVVLTFDGDICDFSTTNACANSRNILQSYGDQPGSLDVIYYRNGVESGLDPLVFWSTGYSGLENVAFGTGLGAIGTAEIFLDPAPGYTVTLHGFSLGAYPNADRSSQYAILGGDGTPLVSSGPITVLGSTPTQVSLVETRSDGIRIRWGPDGYNVAIDDIDFTVSGGPIPEPTTPALLALGLAGLARRALRRCLAAA